MAFAQTAVTTPSNDTSWKAQGFLNFYLPADNGTKIKLGFIGLKESNENQKLLMDWLAADPKNVAEMMTKITVDYQSASQVGKPKFSLA